MGSPFSSLHHRSEIVSAPKERNKDMSKRKADDQEPSSQSVARKRAKPTDDAYTTQQKNSIAQFASITGADRAVAAKFLKDAKWSITVATNNYYGATSRASGLRPALEKLYEKYRSKGEDKDKMDVTAAQNYFADLGVDVENVDVLIASQIVQSPSFGEVTLGGFVQGWGELSCETLSKQKSLIAGYKNDLADTSKPEILDKVYKYAFTLMMQNVGQRSADKGMCIEFWKLLLSAPSLNWQTPAFNWLSNWLEFVTNRPSIKTISRDQWNHVLKFARLSLEDETLGFHNEEQSWPSIVDEFVEHVRKLPTTKAGKARKEDDEEEMEY